MTTQTEARPTKIINVENDRVVVLQAAVCWY